MLAISLLLGTAQQANAEDQEDYYLTALIDVDENDFPLARLADGSVDPDGWDDPVSLAVVFYRIGPDNIPFALETRSATFNPHSPNFPGFLQVTTSSSHWFWPDEKWFFRVINYSIQPAYIDQYVWADMFSRYRVQHSPNGTILQMCHPSQWFFQTCYMVAWNVTAW